MQKKEEEIKKEKKEQLRKVVLNNPKIKAIYERLKDK